KELCNDQIGDLIVYRHTHEDDTLFEQQRVNIVSALAAIALLDDHWDDVVCIHSDGALEAPAPFVTVRSQSQFQMFLLPEIPAPRPRLRVVPAQRSDQALRRGQSQPRVPRSSATSSY